MSGHRPSDYLHAPDAPGREDRLLQGALRGERRIRVRRRALAVGGTLAMLGLAALGLSSLSRAPQDVALGPHVDEPPAVSASATGAAPAPRRFTFENGTVVTPDELAVVDGMESPAERRVVLQSGSVTVNVPEDAGTTHTVDVVARNLHIDTEGSGAAVFTVDKPSGSDGKVHVTVERGTVRIGTSKVVLAFIGAGQSWTEGDAPNARAALPPPVDPAAEAEAARKLFDQGSAARLGGKPSVAATAFDRLRKEHPRDARAGYAAFELGRIRLDALNDPRGAQEAFGFAIVHPGPGFFPDDAEAGLIEAFARAGDEAACVRARDTFLARHGTSPQAKRVSKQCDGVHRE